MLLILAREGLQVSGATQGAEGRANYTPQYHSQSHLTTINAIKQSLSEQNMPGNNLLKQFE